VAFRSTQDAIRAGLALVPEDRLNCGALGRMTVAENLSLPTVERYFRRGRLRRRAERERVMALIQEFDVQPPDPNRLMARLSGGNQQKAILAKWIETDPDVLLLDEPVQGVDVGSKAEIWRIVERLVEDRGTTVLVTSSDFEDLQGICHRVLVLQGGRVVADLAGEDKTVEHMIEQAYLTEVRA
jgi:ABC-type sugar transport system ATPase subunit